MSFAVIAIALTQLAIMPARAQNVGAQQRGQPSPVVVDGWNERQPTDSLLALAQSGVPEAQYLLGSLHDQGKLVPLNPERAVYWWRQAAEQGLVEAQNELGTALVEGYGAPADPEEAIHWYRQAAEQGMPVAYLNLGNMYWSGAGVGVNHELAVEWFRKAAAHGQGWAQTRLGDAYHSGRGVRPDITQALGWYRKAANQDYTEAQYRFGILMRANPGINLAEPGDGVLQMYGEYWVARAARGGYGEAITRLENVFTHQCRRVRLRGPVAVRSGPDAEAPVIRQAGQPEQACVLPEPGSVMRVVRDWTAVYLPEGHTVGFVSRDALRGR